MCLLEKPEANKQIHKSRNILHIWFLTNLMFGFSRRFQKFYRKSIIIFQNMCQNVIFFLKTYNSQLTNRQECVLMKDKPSSLQRDFWENLDESKHMEYEKLYYYILQFKHISYIIYIFCF